MLKRVLTAIPLIGLLVAAVAFGPVVRGAMLTLFAVISVYEMGTVFNKKGAKPFLGGAYLFAAGQFAAYYYLGEKYLLLLMMAGILLTIAERVMNRERQTDDALYSLIIFIYPLLLYAILTYIAAIKDASMARTAMLMAFMGPLMGDTLAYFVGVLLGKRPLCPDISPKKTVEGSVGGVVGGALGGVAVYYIQLLWQGATPIVSLVITGLLCGVLGQIGDLFASTIKRWALVKDYGTIFPGHGGVMDRVDSVLFCAPVIFAYFCLIG